MWNQKSIFSSKKGGDTEASAPADATGNAEDAVAPPQDQKATPHVGAGKSMVDEAINAAQEALSSTRLSSFFSSSSSKMTDDVVESDNELPSSVTNTEQAEPKASEPTIEKKYAFNPDYKWPNLFEEADAMLQASLLIYVYADLRRLAREGKLSDGANEKVFDLPMPALTCMSIIEQNEEALARWNDEKDIKICREALRAIHERTEITEQGLELAQGVEHIMSMSTLEHFSDTNSEKELVFAIGVDRWYRRITVAFRGSVTANDFLTDACISMVDRPNPVYEFDEDNQDENIKLHSGFYEYLLETSEERERTVSKFDEVMAALVPLLEQNPEFTVYCSGHSLGGALATLFSFELVTSTKYSSIPSPVTCVSVASPKLGNESFRKAFQFLEERGDLRHLRIANEKDPVPLGPPASSKLMLASLSPAALLVMSHVSDTIEKEMYKHCGMRLKLLADEKKRYKLSPSTGSWKQDLLHPSVSVFHHLGYEYSTRMLRTKQDLEKLYLNDVYKGKGITKDSE